MDTRKFYLELIKRLETESEVDVSTDLRTGEKSFEMLKNDSPVFFETISGMPSIVICGAGHVSQQLASLMKRLDWHVTVIDDRAEFLTEERFPDIDCRLNIEFKNLKDICFPTGTFYAIMTRGHKNDFECLADIIKRPFGYLGMIGSQKKVGISIEALREMGIEEKLISQLHAPIGLSIGAQTPAEISVSIAAEIISEFYKREISYFGSDIKRGIINGDSCVLATIIKKSGSSPRDKGTRMLVFEDGICGTIGGGALEAAVIRDAGLISEFSLKSYDMTNEQASELGMVCGGKIDVMFERL